jgi:hypothetical protein
MTTKRKNRLRKMTFLNTHRLSDKKEDDKYTRDTEFIDKNKNDYFITISPRVARGSLRP